MVYAYSFWHVSPEGGVDTSTLVHPWSGTRATGPEMSAEDPEQLCPGGRELVDEAQAVLANAAIVREMLARSGEDPLTVRPAWLADLSETRWRDKREADS